MLEGALVTPSPPLLDGLSSGCSGKITSIYARY